MKFSAVIVTLVLTLTSQASSFTFQDSIELEKVYVSKNILPSKLMNLYQPFTNKRVRMIAGKKSSWSDELRQRLRGMNSYPSIKF